MNSSFRYTSFTSKDLLKELMMITSMDNPRDNSRDMDDLVKRFTVIRVSIDNKYLGIHKPTNKIKNSHNAYCIYSHVRLIIQ
jgi:hypothetical protein